METAPVAPPNPKAAKFMLRFEDDAQHVRLKATARKEKRSLNKQILLLIEAGEAALRQVPGASE